MPTLQCSTFPEIRAWQLMDMMWRFSLFYRNENISKCTVMCSSVGHNPIFQSARQFSPKIKRRCTLRVVVDAEFVTEKGRSNG